MQTLRPDQESLRSDHESLRPDQESLRSDHESLRPVHESLRIDSIDVLRGVAVLGILMINIVGLGLPDPAYFDPSEYGGASGWNLRMFFFNSVFFEGAMRGIFSMLFGAGIILFLKKKEEAGAGLELADLWYRRVIWLIILGLFHAYLLVWPGEILYAYGMIGMILFPFRNVKPRKLIYFSIGIILLGVVLNHASSLKAKRQQAHYFEALEMFQNQETVPYDVLMDYYAWIERYAVMKPNEQRLNNRVMNMQNGYLPALKEMSKDTYFFQSEYHYRHNYIDILSMMLLGMAFLKLRIFHAERSYRFYLVMLMIGYGIGIPLNIWETLVYIKQEYSLITYYDLLRTYDVGRVGTMLGHIGLIMILIKSGFLKYLLRLIGSVGRMALSNYLMQTILANLVFIGFAMYGKLSRAELYYIVLAIWIFQIIFSSIWLKYFAFGPAEWAWRSLTYRKVFRLRR